MRSNDMKNSNTKRNPLRAVLGSLFAGTLVLLASAAHAGQPQATQSFCNQTDSMVWVSLMFRHPPLPNWHVTGWHAATPGQCITPLKSASDSPVVLWTATGQDGNKWTGEREGCVLDGQMELDVTDPKGICSQPGAYPQAWHELNRAGKRKHTMTLEGSGDDEPKTLHEARVRGADRMLHKVGYGTGAGAVAAYAADHPTVGPSLDDKFMLDLVSTLVKTKASQEFCNKTLDFVLVSMMFQEGSLWHAKGWYSAAPGQCITPWESGADSPVILWTAQDDRSAPKPGHWSGSREGCATGDRLDLVITDPKDICTERGAFKRSWYELDRRGILRHTQNLRGTGDPTDPKTLDEARVRGTDRLLQRLGYDSGPTAIAAYRNARSLPAGTEVDNTLLADLRTNLLGVHDAAAAKLREEQAAKARQQQIAAANAERQRRASEDLAAREAEEKRERRSRVVSIFGTVLQGVAGGVLEGKYGIRPGSDPSLASNTPRTGETPDSVPFTPKLLKNWGEWSTAATPAGRPALQICIRDSECEDGDILKVAVNGRQVMREVLTNAGACELVPFDSGENTISIYAVNGTGYQGTCDFSDVNTGVISVASILPDGSIGGPISQQWNVRGGAGSESRIRVHVVP